MTLVKRRCNALAPTRRQRPRPDGERRPEHHERRRSDHQQLVLNHVRAEQLLRRTRERRKERRGEHAPPHRKADCAADNVPSMGASRTCKPEDAVRVKQPCRDERERKPQVDKRFGVDEMRMSAVRVSVTRGKHAGE